MKFIPKKGDGFYIQKSLTPNNAQNNKFTHINSSVVSELSNNSNWMLSNVDFVFVSGNIYAIDFVDQADIESIFEKALKKQDFSGFSKIIGDYVLAFGRSDKVIIYNSIASQFECFWKFENQTVFVSNLHYLLVGMKDINIDSLPLLCYGEQVNIYRNLNVLKANCALIIDNGKCRILNHALRLNNPIPFGTSINEIGEVLYSSVLNYVRTIVKDKKKCSLLLSGGIDSATIARCLYDLNIDADFYTWGSSNSEVNEANFSREIAHMFGKEIIQLNVDEQPYNYLFPKNQSTHFPYFNPLSSWIELVFDLSKENGSDIIFTGEYAELIQTKRLNRFEPSLNLNVQTWDKITRGIVLYNQGLSKIKNVSIPRKNEIFTPFAREQIVNHLKNHNIPHMNTYHYCYKTNFVDLYNISWCSPFLNQDYLSLAYYMPKKYTKHYYAGFMINKIALRHAMIDKLPHSIVSRSYPSNMNYMITKTFIPQSTVLLERFNEDSYLVKNGILDLNYINKISREKDLYALDRNKTTLIPSLLIEDWFERNNRKEYE